MTASASATVSHSCSFGSSSFCSYGMSNGYNFHHNTQNWRPTSSLLPYASSTRFIMSSNFLGIFYLQNPKVNLRGTIRAHNRFQLIFPRSGSESNGDNDIGSGENDENDAIKTLLKPFVSKMSLSRSGRGRSSLGVVAAGLLVAVIVSGAVEMDQVSVSAAQSQVQNETEQEVEPGETMANIPQTLSGECALETDCKKPRIQRPKSRKAETCTIKCVGTCIRGGGGSPGEGPFNIRRPLVVFKEGFRSRRYCLVECSDICNLIGDGDDGP